MLFLSTDFYKDFPGLWGYIVLVVLKYITHSPASKQCVMSLLWCINPQKWPTQKMRFPSAVVKCRFLSTASTSNHLRANTVDQFNSQCLLNALRLISRLNMIRKVTKLPLRLIPTIRLIFSEHSCWWWICSHKLLRLSFAASCCKMSGGQPDNLLSSLYARFTSFFLFLLSQFPHLLCTVKSDIILQP